MEELLSSLIVNASEQEKPKSTYEILKNAAKPICKHFGADIVVGYCLNPETGGVPQARMPPIFEGTLRHPTTAEEVLRDVKPKGLLRNLIRRWEPSFLRPEDLEPALQYSPSNEDGYAQFIQSEGITSCYVMPLEHEEARLGFLVCNYRDHNAFNPEHLPLFEICRMLVASHLAQVYRTHTVLHVEKSRKAIAHTRYGEVASIFRAQIQSLENDLRLVLGKNIPSQLAHRFREAKGTVFDMMRNLVIEAAGDLLVELQEMSLSKALTTTAAALCRAWPSSSRVSIIIHEIPPIIEKQPYKIRRLLYAFALEAMGNAIKHAGPPPYIGVDMRWYEPKEQIIVLVLDHGKGFDTKTVQLSSNGLGFWKDYLEEHLEGEFKLKSSPEYGTVVEAKFPIIP